MKRDMTASFLVSSAFGFLIWALSPIVTGSIEPWDASSLFYIAALIVAGFIVGLLFPRRLWPVLVGIATGQFIYMLLFTAKGPLIAVGVAALFVYGLLALGAAFVASRLRRLLGDSLSSR
jgi:hypothetical protein